MMKSEIIWAIASAIFTFLLSTATIYLLLGGFHPGFFFIPPAILIISLVFFGTWELLVRSKNLARTAFLISLLTVGVFTGALSTGLCESIILLEDSYIDITHCACILDMKNTGLTDTEVLQVMIDDIIVPVSTRWGYLFSRGETTHLVVFYAHERFQWGMG